MVWIAGHSMVSVVSFAELHVQMVGNFLSPTLLFSYFPSCTARSGILTGLRCARQFLMYRGNTLKIFTNMLSGVPLSIAFNWNLF